MNLDELLVLVIEPSRLQRNIIIDRLKEVGLREIESFEQVGPALERMQGVIPDIVVSSMHLPDMTGTELVTRMRTSEALMDVTFLLISSRSEEHTSELQSRPHLVCRLLLEKKKKKKKMN